MRAYGETDFAKGLIRINKKLHENKKKAAYGVAKKDNTLLNTLVHEMHHVEHPKKHEKTVRKDTRKKISSMSTKQKAKYYKLIA